MAGLGPLQSWQMLEPPTAGWLSSTLPLGCGWPCGALLGLLPDSTGERLPSPGISSPRLPPHRAVEEETQSAGAQSPLFPKQPSQDPLALPGLDRKWWQLSSQATLEPALSLGRPGCSDASGPNCPQLLQCGPRAARCGWVKRPGLAWRRPDLCRQLPLRWQEKPGETCFLPRE
ncbi:unnamed protein product [Rangifer tarandus platyrhynchus]|uniref:Uncharacterized protein n=1 Tax=Rangifer tarandus platyrhynchus TaxID=3082113 RepID=A0ABN8YE88_RANTA|nr:unnamed protein product [Rangifer tarandus platyrhynchus]